MLSMPLCANGFCIKLLFRRQNETKPETKRTQYQFVNPRRLFDGNGQRVIKSTYITVSTRPFPFSSHTFLSLSFSRATAFYACIVFIRLCYVTDVVINNEFFTLLRNGNSSEINYGNSRTGALFSLCVISYFNLALVPRNWNKNEKWKFIISSWSLRLEQWFFFVQNTKGTNNVSFIMMRTTIESLE